jgi:hypothetical protein
VILDTGAGEEPVRLCAGQACVTRPAPGTEARSKNPRPSSSLPRCPPHPTPPGGFGSGGLADSETRPVHPNRLRRAIPGPCLPVLN